MIAGVTKHPWRWLLRLPRIVICTRHIPAGTAGAALGPFIGITPEHYQEEDIHIHERVHVAQWWKSVVIFSPFIAGIAVLWYHGGVIFGGLPLLLLYAAWRVTDLINCQYCEAEALTEQFNFLGQADFLHSDEGVDAFSEAYDIVLTRPEVREMFNNQRPYAEGFERRSAVEADRSLI